MKHQIVNMSLRTALAQSGESQQRVAERACIDWKKLSHAIYGRRALDRDERRRLAGVLEKSESELFPLEVATS